MKIKKISLVLFSVTSIILTALFMQSCNRDYEEIYPLLTNADELVASSDFQEFQVSMEAFAEDLRIKYVNLSKSDRKKFSEILSILADQNTVDSKELYEKANSIIGIDMELQQKKIREQGSLLIEARNISQKELIIAMKKQDIARTNTTIRLKSGGEEEDGDEEFQKCKNSCSTSYVACALIGSLIPPPGNVGAYLICTTVYVACIADC